MIKLTMAILALLLLLSSGCDDAGDKPDAGAAADLRVDLALHDLLADSPATQDSQPDSFDEQAAVRCEPSATLMARVDPALMFTDLKFLTDLGERGSHEGHQATVDYLEAELSKIPGAQVVLQEFTYKEKPYYNVEMTIPGVEFPDELVIAGAHYDSYIDVVGLGPGADDNASGTVAILGAARSLGDCKPRRSVRFVFFALEERGLFGSEKYVSLKRLSMPPEKVVGVLNADMVGFIPRPEEDLDFTGRAEDKPLLDKATEAAKLWAGLPIKKVISSDSASDELSFRVGGYSALAISTQFVRMSDVPMYNPNYHSPRILWTPWTLSSIRALPGRSSPAWRLWPIDPGADGGDPRSAVCLER